MISFNQIPTIDNNSSGMSQIAWLGIPMKFFALNLLLQLSHHVKNSLSYETPAELQTQMTYLVKEC